jgi:hypothetical protein
MAAIKATTKRAALIFIVSSPSQIGVGHLKKWVGHNHTLIDAGSKAKASALQEEDNSMAQGHYPLWVTTSVAGCLRDHRPNSASWRSLQSGMTATTLLREIKEATTTVDTTAMMAIIPANLTRSPVAPRLRNRSSSRQTPSCVK